MKKIFNFTLLFLLLSSTLSAIEIDDLSFEVQANFDRSEFSNKKVMLQVPHSNFSFLDLNNLGELEGQMITKITLIYSAFCEDPNFDQDGLNLSRIEQLQKILPKDAINDQMEWSALALNSCMNSTCAEYLWHGFIIEYDTKNPLHYTNIEIQKYKINSDRSVTLQGKNGTIIEIPASCFEDQQGNAISGEVDFELREALDLETLVNGNLNTMTDKNEILESDGSVQMEAFQGNKKLKIKNGKGITIKLPKNSKNEDMSFWDGTFKNGKIEWEPALEGDITESRDTEDWTWTEVEALETNITTETLFDMMTTTGENPRTDDKIGKKTTTRKSVKKKIENDNKAYQILNSQTLGWINCDAPIFRDEVLNLSFEMICSNDTLVDYLNAYVIFPDKNSILQLAKNYRGKKEGWTIPGNGMPREEKFIIMIYGNKDDQEYSLVKSFDILKESKLSIDLKNQDLSSSLQELKKLI